MNRIPIALQLWSLNEDCQKDFAETVRHVSRLGYRGVELAGYGNLDVYGAAKALAQTKLLVTGMHVGLARLQDELTLVVKEAKFFGAQHITCPSWPKEAFTSATTCQVVGEQLNAIGAALRGEGIKFSYHNHAPEFAEIEGRRVLDWILDASEPRNLGCELDVYWAHVGNKNPASFIHEQGRRVTLIHLKDEKELGLGPVNFPEVFLAAAQVGTVEWYIVEQEKYNYHPLESARINFEQLRKWGQV